MARKKTTRKTKSVAASALSQREKSKGRKRK